VARANKHLDEMANNPRVDTTALKRKIAKDESDIGRLFNRVRGSSDDALCAAYDRQIALIQKKIDKSKADLRDLEVRNRPVPPAITKDFILAISKDIRDLLDQEPAAAAGFIRALTGPIQIGQEFTPGKKRGARWIATFSPDLLALLHKLSCSRDYPDSIPLEYLTTRKWIKPEPKTVIVDHIPACEKLGPRVLELASNGASINTIAGALGISWELAQQSLEYARTGRRPHWRPKRPPTGKGGKPAMFKAIADQVVHFRDVEKRSFVEISRLLGVGTATIARAYDFAKPDEVRKAAAAGTAPRRGSHARLGLQTYEQIRTMLKGNQSIQVIADELGCGLSTIYREKRKMIASI
jgi:transposase-like protein